MLQRIQSLYLLIVAVLTVLMYFFVFLYIESPDSLSYFKPIFTTTLCLLTSLTTIFLYKNRKLQIKFCYANIVFLGLTYAETGIYLYSQLPANYMFLIGSIIPPICIILTFLAIRAIKKDENLVKSLDRIR